MKQIYFIKCKKYRKFKKPKISYIFDKTLVCSIICDNCDKNELRYQKFLINNVKEYQINIYLIQKWLKKTLNKNLDWKI